MYKEVTDSLLSPSPLQARIRLPRSLPPVLSILPSVPLPITTYALPVPSLSSLVFTVKGSLVDWPIEPFDEMRIRSGFTLVELSITACKLSIPNLDRVLRLLPSITTLRLQDAKSQDDEDAASEDMQDSMGSQDQYLVSTELVSSLTVSSSSLRFCEEDQRLQHVPLPYLENLSLTTSNQKLSKDTILQLVKSRSTFASSSASIAEMSHLKRVSLRLPSKLSKGLLKTQIQ